jgi:hypothetical protein
MPNKQDVVSEQLTELKQDLHDLWVALSRDPKKQARRERTWLILSGALAAGATMMSRKLTTKIWGVLTGEDPPATQKAREDAAQKARVEAMQTPGPPPTAAAR